MALKIWLPLVSSLNNQGTEISNFYSGGSAVPTLSTAGPLGNSYTFNGSSNVLKGTYTVAESEFTVCMWVTFTKLGVHLLDMRNSDSTGYQPMYVSSSGVQVGGSNSSYVYINFVPTLNTWYHLCVVSNATKTQLYVNGELYGETTSAKATNFNKVLNVSLGARYTNANWFGGGIADFRIYNEVLSPYEIKTIAQGLLLHYTKPLTSTPVGKSVMDSSGFGRNGEVFIHSFGYGNYIPARYGHYWYTDTNGEYISTPSPSASTKTICFWLRTPKTASTVFFADYKSKLAFGFNSSGYIITSCDSLSTPMFTDTSAISDLYILCHIVVRKNSANTGVELFINGVQQTADGSNNYWTHSTDTLMIGGRSTGTPMPNAGFCDFRMYAKRLTDDEILDLYHTSLKQLNSGKSSPFELEEVGVIVQGDLDGDGQVTDADATYLESYLSNPTSYPLNQSGDFNGDGVVNQDDADYLLYHVYFGDEDYPLLNEVPTSGSKPRVKKSGLLSSGSFIESTVNNKFKAIEIISNEFIER